MSEQGGVVLLLWDCSLSSGWDTQELRTLTVPAHSTRGGDQGTLWGQGGAKGTLRGCLLPFQVPTAGEDDAACLPEQEWGGLDSRQQELYRMAVKGSYEAVVSLGKDQSLRTSRTLCHLPSTTPGCAGAAFAQGLWCQRPASTVGTAASSPRARGRQLQTLSAVAGRGRGGFGDQDPRAAGEGSGVRACRWR